MGRPDFFDLLTPEQKKALADEYRAGPQPLQRMGPHWGDGLSVICAGGEAQMMRVAEARFRQKFHAGPCPMGHYGPDQGGPPLTALADRLGEG